MAVYPAALPDTGDLPSAGADLSTPPHSDLHDDTRDEIIAIAAELGVAPSGSYSTVRARLDAGWQPIAGASFSGASTVDISIPASTYAMVRIHIMSDSSVGGVGLIARINNDSTASLHAYSYMEGTNDTFTTTSTTGTSYIIGAIAATSGNVTVLQLFDTDVSSRCPFKSESVARGSTEAGTFLRMAGGNLASNRLISSVRLAPSSGTITGRYVCEGYVLP